MKKYISIIIAAALATILVSCEKQSAGVTRITYYPTLELFGDNPCKIAKGGTFTDPGCKAEMNGEDVTSQVNIDLSAVNSAVPGVYPVVYSIVNPDGITAKSIRYVYVIDPAGGIANVYSGACRNGSGTRNYSGCPTVVYATSTPGVYLVDDLMAGFYYYFIYPGYEPTYDFHWEGYIQVSGASVSLVDCGEWYFYEAGDDISSGSYNAATGVLQWICFGSILSTLTPMTLD